MAKVTEKLTAMTVRKKKKPGRYSDGDGLWLQVSPTGTKSWLFQYSINGKRNRQHGIGVVAVSAVDARDPTKLSLSQARDKAAKLNADVKNGIDPIEAKQRIKLDKQIADQQQAEAEVLRKAAKLAEVTFKQAAMEYIAENRHEWKSRKHADQWDATLKTYAYPTIGDLPVHLIETAHVRKVLSPLWTKKAETANRLRGRIELVLQFAAAQGYRSRDLANPAKLGDLALKKRKPGRVRVKHHASMPYQDLPAFMARLRANPSISARALEFLILTATRTGAVIGATESEVDAAGKLWTVPADRPGTKIVDETIRRVPLSKRALQIVEQRTKEIGNPHLFPGGSKGKPLSNMAMLELLKGMEPGLTVHGFRSTFKVWCGEQTSYPNDVSEAALWHVVLNESEASYKRTDFLEKRRRLMEDWASYCEQPPAARGDNVTSIRASKEASQ